MTLLKQVAADVGRIALAILGSAFALVFTAGVGDGIAEAQDPFEVLIGLVFGVVVVSVAAGVTSYVTLPALRHLGAAWQVALDSRASTGARAHLSLLAALDLLGAALVMAVGAARYRQGFAAHEGRWAQQGALILVGGVVLGGGTALARLVAVARAGRGRTPRRGEHPAHGHDLGRSAVGASADAESLARMTFCLGLGLAMAMALDGAP
ncbi:MAG: hypothetical protein KC593_11745 [Myxococcales bacterium]|nr:hypothetical protein [Myxococcales bacterium]MCB9626277.1 hypothetical protein [Sandaracinaceae bacterium]